VIRLELFDDVKCTEKRRARSGKPAA
jgi:hypothetical protein